MRILLLFILTCPLFARIDFEDSLYPELLPSSRALAMGNAFISKANDESAAFYNPAGLGSFRKWQFHISNFTVETNKGLASSVSDSPGDTIGETMKAFDLDELRQTHVANPGIITHSRVSFAPNFTTRYLSFGYLYARRTRATLGTASGSQFEFADRTDHGPYVASNLSMFGGIFKIGASVAWLNRRETIGEVDPNNTLVLTSSQKGKGEILMVTTGAKLTLPFWALPTFAATVHNSAGRDFNTEPDYGPMINPTQNIVLGFSLTPQIGKTTRMHLEVNYRDFGQRHEDLDNSRRWTAGMEFDVFRMLFFRLGYADGFGSGGIGFRAKTFRMDLSTYAVDTTTSQFRGEEDRRFALSISSGF